MQHPSDKPDRRRRGRPRDPEIGRQVLQAVRGLLAEEGFAGTTIQAVARRADVRPAAIYRRWPNRLRMIEEAIFPGLDEVTVKPTGVLRDDLARFVTSYQAAIAAPAALAALPALVSAYHSIAGAQETEARAWRSARPQLRAILNAVPACEIDRAIDSDDVFDLLVGAILYKIHMRLLGGRIETPDRTIALVCRVLRPHAG